MTCVCGHPRERHAFGQGFCTHHAKTEGASHVFCRCTEYREPQPIEKDEDSYYERALRGDIA